MSVLTQWYYDYAEVHRDRRVDGWPLVDNPFIGMVMSFAYLAFAVKIGPSFMKNRKPYELKYLMIIYNVLIVVLSAFMVCEFLLGGWWDTYSLGCEPVEKGDSPRIRHMMHALWLFYISKYLEFLDTIFFILRRKFHLVTVLHVFHHFVMPLTTWIGMRFSPGGMATFCALINSFVHVWMYTYYAIAALGPQYKKYIWWKRYMTKLQIFQFLCIFIHGNQFFYKDCDYPKAYMTLLMVINCCFLGLFANYYIQEYIHRKRNNNNKSIKNDTKNGHTTKGYSQNGHSNGLYDKID